MSVLEWIDYGLIVIFFVTVAALIVVVTMPTRKEGAISSALPPIQQNKMTYIGLAILCLFILSMALLSNNQSDTR